MFERAGLAAAAGFLLPMMLLAPPAADAVVIVDSAVYAGHQYYLLSPGTWLESEAAAVSLAGGHLVTIEDASENAFLVQRFGVDSGLFAQRQDLWIGLTDQAVEGTFVWADGVPLSPLSYSNWHPGEPNDCHTAACISEDYVHMTWWGTPGRWNDLTNDLVQLYGVAEVDHVVPEPSSLVLLSLGVAGLVGRTRRRIKL